MVRKSAILGFILVVAAASMAWAGTFTGAIPAPQPSVVPAAAPACVGGVCPPPMKVMKPPVMAAPKFEPKKLSTAIDVKVQYPQPVPPMMMPSCDSGPPPIPVAVPMWKFVVPWPPFVYYVPVE